MYTREYDSEMRLPGGYSGVALSPCEEEHHPEPKPPEKSGITSILPDSLLHLFRKDRLSGFKIGLEEILIIAAAAFLFFSKDGDIECALMLLVLLFIF